VYFYGNNYEIDFLDRNDWMVEVKYRNKVIKEDFGDLAKVKTSHQKIVLSRNDLILSEDIKIIPVDYYLFLQGGGNLLEKNTSGKR
jgi:predicted AAA+ superfamily ATPase